MVKAKVSFLLGAVLLIAGCAPKPTSVGDHAGFTWQKFLMDGSRTGVTAVVGTDVKAALGSVVDGVYTAPNGRVFTEGSVVAAASGLLACQDTLAYLKEVVGQCPTGMVRAGCNSQMASWTADVLARGVESITGKKVDMAVTNLGGIRLDMPKGDVLLDDISSMFPFRNYLCYVALRGSDVRALLEQLQGSGISISIATKSDLVVRDLDLIKTFPNARVSWSINTLDEAFRRQMDRGVSI